MVRRGAGRPRRRTGARTATRAGARVAAVVSAGALIAVAAGLGAAGPAQAQADDAAPFFGTSVELTDDVFTTPTVDSGTYVTELDKGDLGDGRFLNITRSIPNSTVWIGVSTQKPADYAELDQRDADKDTAGLQQDDIVDVDVYADGNTGQACGDSFDGAVATPEADETEPFQTALFNSGGETCRDATMITVRLGSTSYLDAPIATQLVIWEEPPIDDQRGLPQASRSVAWAELPPVGEPEQITPGTSYADAPDVSSGTFTFHVDRDRPAFFRMPLDWGQHGQALLTTDATFADDVDSLGHPSVRWIGPMGGVTQEATITEGPRDTWSSSLAPSGGQRVLPTVSPIVAWNQRKATSPDDGLDKYRMSGLAGSYFLVVAGGRALTDEGADITLQTGYFADYAGGVPTYQEKPTPMPQVFDAGPDAVTATSARAVPDDRPPGPPWTTVWLVLGAAVVVAVVGGGTLAWKGRTA